MPTSSPIPAVFCSTPAPAWILYKLDGGIDHLLLDEVQDTAPTQWDIAGAIAAEFFAGAGARDIPRSVFAVGDAKQSIFSFQGADLQSFETYRAKFRAQVTDAGQAWLDGQLSVSFRSTAPVLALTDAVFAQGPARTGVCETAPLTHGVSRIGQAGSVTLWPLTQAVAAPALPSWAPPSDYQGADLRQSHPGPRPRRPHKEPAGLRPHSSPAAPAPSPPATFWSSSAAGTSW